jgi:histone-lysine N-methyltransferase SETD3
MPSAQQDADAEASFVAWLLEGGASFPKLEWPVFDWPGQPHDGERGVRCIADIAPGEEMFSIPGKILFNRAACLASPIASVFKENRDVLFSERDELALTLLLLYEKLERGDASPWMPMIRALPAQPPAASLWTEAELALLQDDALRAECILKAAHMQHTYSQVFLPLIERQKVLGPQRLQKYSFHEFRWALLCVESRTFGRFLPLPSLVPFADLLNHVNVQTSYRWDPSRAAAVFCADASGLFPHACGAEAFMSYGPRSNAELLLHYGFALRNNRYERVALQARPRRPPTATLSACVW